MDEMIHQAIIQYFNKSKKKYKRKIDQNFEEFFDVLTLHAYLKKTKFKILKWKLEEDEKLYYRTIDPLKRYLIVDEYHHRYLDEKYKKYLYNLDVLYSFSIDKIARFLQKIGKMDISERRFTLKGYL